MSCILYCYMFLPEQRVEDIKRKFFDESLFPELKINEKEMSGCAQSEMHSAFKHDQFIIQKYKFYSDEYRQINILNFFISCGYLNEWISLMQPHVTKI